MLAQVENKINELNKQQIVEYYKKREEDLVNWGIVTKKGKKKKEVPLIITDDEYEALVKAHTQVGKSGRNSMAQLLSHVATAMVVAGIMFAFAFYQLSADIGFIGATAIIVVAIFMALVLKGVSEAIKLLQQVSDNEVLFRPTQEVILNVLAQTQPQSQAEEVVEQPAQEPDPVQEPEVFPEQPAFPEQPVFK